MAQADFLLKRGQSFWENANDLLKKGDYSLAAFNFEQTCQLYLKYYLFLKLKDFPKTHSLHQLLEDIGEAYGKQRAIARFIDQNASVIGDLEQAYISSRYLPVEFHSSQTKAMKRFTQKLIRFLKQL